MRCFHLQNKLLLLTLPFVIVPILVFGFISSDRIENMSRQSLENRVEAKAEHLSKTLHHLINMGQANLALFSQHELVRQYLLSDEDERYSLLHPAVLNTFHNFHKAYPQYYEIRLILPDGFEDVRFANYSENRTEEESHNLVIQNLVASERETAFVFADNPDNGRPSLYMARKIVLTDFARDNYDETPKLRGYLVITSDMADIQHKLDLMAKSLQARFQLIDAQGGLYLQSEDHLTFTASEQFASISANFIEDKMSLDLKPHDSLVTSFSVGEKVYDHGVFRLNHSLFFTSSYPQSLYLQADSEMQITLFIQVFLLILLLSVVLILGLKGLILSPISALAKAASSIQRNTQAVKVAVKRNDELGHLARSFEQMSSTLATSAAKMKKQAFTDSLTGLPNRFMFNKFLDILLAKSMRNKEQFALMFIDLDNFKVVNDTLGHNSGDKLLRVYAGRLGKVLRGEDYICTNTESVDSEFIARLGGDEFIVTLPYTSGVNEIASVANRIIDVLSEPVMLNDYEYFGSTSIGISVFPMDGASSEELVQHADTAMFYAKNRGKNGFYFYSKQMGKENEELNHLEVALRKAMREEQGLSLHYQPQIDVHSGKINGFEVLIRWQLPNGEMVNPEKMIKVAEQRGLIIPLTEWIVNEACRQNSTWIEQGTIKVPVAVNFSGVHIAREDISKMITLALDRYDLAAQYFEVELTESSLVDSSADILAGFERIRQLGMKIAIDDFGTGFSSLSYLSTFPVDIVKIDRCFVEQIGHENHGAVVKAIIQMSHAFGYKVIAEGVETQEQVTFLRNLNCDTIQGYFYSKPLPAEEVPYFIEGVSEQKVG